MMKHRRRSVAKLTPMVAEEVERLRSVCDGGADEEADKRLDPDERYAWLGRVLWQTERAHGVLNDLVMRDHRAGRDFQLQSWQLAVTSAINACANLGGFIAADEMAKPRALVRWKPVDLPSYVLAIATLAQLLDRRIVTLSAEEMDLIERTAKAERRAR